MHTHIKDDDVDTLRIHVRRGRQIGRKCAYGLAGFLICAYIALVLIGCEALCDITRNAECDITGIHSQDPGGAEMVKSRQYIVYENMPTGLASVGNTLYMVGRGHTMLYMLNTLNIKDENWQAVAPNASPGFGVDEYNPTGLAAIGNVLYMVGQDTATLYMLDIGMADGTWHSVVPDAAPGFGIGENRPTGLTAVNNTIYMVGEDTGAMHALDISMESTEWTRPFPSVPVGFGVHEYRPTGLAAMGYTLFMTGSATDMLVVLDGNTGIARRVGRAFRFGSRETEPGDMTAIGKTLYMVGQRHGALYMLNYGSGMAMYYVHTCHNGTPADGITTVIKEVERCADCDAAYALDDEKCAPYTYSCAGGQAAIGHSDGHDEQQCVKCDSAYTLDNGVCVPNVYTCVNGTVASGAPEVNHDHRCASCNFGYTLNTTTFRCESRYTCPNGTPADGMPKIPDTVRCERCDLDYALEDGVCNSIFRLHSNRVTVICQAAMVGDSGVINGITYKKRHKGEITAENAAVTCTSDIEDMSNLFLGRDTFNTDISSWDTSSVTNMSAMFGGAKEFNQDIGRWNTGNVVDMSLMFNAADAFNHDIGEWDTGNVTDMSGMFNAADAFNQDISGWDTKRVANVDLMFNSADLFNQDLSGWCMRSVASEPAGFSTSSALEDEHHPAWGECGHFAVHSNMVTIICDEAEVGDTRTVNGMAYTRRTVEQIDTENAAATCTSGITDMASLFLSEHEFNGDIGSWDTSNVTTMNRMFYNAAAFNQDIGDWDTSNVMSMTALFHGATQFNHDLSDWCMANIPAVPDADFARLAALTPDNYPVWGACP